MDSESSGDGPIEARSWVPVVTSMSDFIPVAVAVVEHGGAVLVGRRPPDATLAGLWEFPGGKVLPGEEPAEAAQRECLEETGQAVRIVGLEAELCWEYAHARLRVFFFAAVPDGPLVRPRAPFTWVPASGLSADMFPPANAQIVASLLQRFPRW